MEVLHLALDSPRDLFTFLYSTREISYNFPIFLPRFMILFCFAFVDFTFQRYAVLSNSIMQILEGIMFVLLCLSHEFLCNVLLYKIYDH